MLFQEVHPAARPFFARARARMACQGHHQAVLNPKKTRSRSFADTDTFMRALNVSSPPQLLCLRVTNCASHANRRQSSFQESLHREMHSSRSCTMPRGIRIQAPLRRPTTSRSHTSHTATYGCHLQRGWAVGAPHSQRSGRRTKAVLAGVVFGISP